MVVGAYGAGLTVTVDRAPEAGETVIGHFFSSGPGGKGSNQAIAAARLGAAVHLCSVLGNDHYGADALELWNTEGVQASLVHTVAGSTMVGVILVEANGENRIAIAPGVLEMFSTAHLVGLDHVLSSADVLLVSLEIPLTTAVEALRRGRAMGVTTILNPAPAPTSRLPDGALDLVDVLTPNRTEAAQLAGLPVTTDPQLLLEANCFDNIATIALTLGREGVLLRHQGVVTSVPAVPVAAVDSTGAGDAFNGALAIKLAQNWTALEAVQFATYAAAYSVGRHEVVPSLPRPSDLANEVSRQSATVRSE